MSRLAVIVLCVVLCRLGPAVAEQPPEFKNAYLAYRSLLEQGMVDKAIPHAEKALEIALRSDAFDDRTRAVLTFNLGHLFYLNSRHADATEEYSKAISLLEGSGSENARQTANMYNHRGRSAIYLSRYDEAEKDLKHALELLTGDAVAVRLLRADTLEHLAWVEIGRGNGKEALQYVEGAERTYRSVLPAGDPHIKFVQIARSAATWVDGNKRKARDLLADTLGQIENAKLVSDNGHFKRKPGQITRLELLRFHRSARDLYILMGREKDAEYHGRIVTELRKGLTPASFGVVPVRRVPPQYPKRAAGRGVEGWVIVEFTVRKDGSTDDIKIVDSSDPVFDWSAIKAVKYWKYEPRLKDGKPVDRPGVRTRIEYALEEP